MVRDFRWPRADSASQGDLNLASLRSLLGLQIRSPVLPAFVPGHAVVDIPPRVAGRPTPLSHGNHGWSVRPYPLFHVGGADGHLAGARGATPGLRHGGLPVDGTQLGSRQPLVCLVVLHDHGES